MTSGRLTLHCALRMSLQYVVIRSSYRWDAMPILSSVIIPGYLGNPGTDLHLAHGAQTAELHASHTQFMSFVGSIAAELARRSLQQQPQQ